MRASESTDPEEAGVATPAAAVGASPPRAALASPSEPEFIRREGLVLLISLCRLAEALAVGMLVPIIPIFVSEVSAPGSATAGIERLASLANALFAGSGAPGAARLADWLSSEVVGLALSLPTLISPGVSGLVAILFFLTGMSMSASQIFAGRLSDRLDARKIFILVGMAGGSVCSACFAGLDTYPGLLLTRVVQGLFLGLTFPPMMAIVARHTAPGRGGRVLGMYTTIRLAGFALGPVVGGAIAEIGGAKSVFFGSAVLLLVSVGLVGWLVPDPREGPRRTRAERAARPPVPWVFRHLGACIFLMMVGISAMISLFPTYKEELHATEFELGVIFSAFIGTRSLLQWPAGWLGDRFDKKLVLVISLAAFAPFVWLQGVAGSVGELIAVRVGLGAVSAAITASVSGISAERSVAGNRARVMGINTLCFSLGTAIGPLCTGFIADRGLAFALPAVAALVWVVVIAMILPSDRAVRERQSPASAPVAPNPQSSTPE